MKYNITLLEDTIKALLRQSGITDKIYPNRPKSATSEQSFVVVEMNASLIDVDTYADCVVGVHLFAKDVNNVKNGQRLNWLYNHVIDGIPAEYEVKDNGNVIASYVIDLNPIVLPDVPDDFGFHARIIQYSITIKNL